MKNELISIGKMAEINQTTIATLRLYDKIGLLHPRYVDSETGYRYYDIQQNARLDMIAYMKELGMSLAEIENVLKKEDITLIEDILARKNEQIHQQIRELNARHDAVTRAISSIERYRKSPRTGTISLEYIDRRYIWAIPCTTNFYAKGIRSYEEVLIELRRELIANGISQFHSYNTGTSILMEHFVEENFVPHKAFVFSDKKFGTNENGIAIIDSGMFACIYLDNYDKELDYAKKLLAFCKEQQYTIAGDYLCEVLTEFNVFDSGHRNMFMRLQVPVSFPYISQCDSLS